MKNQSPAKSIIELNVAIPDLLVKTHHGNIHLKSLISDKRIIVYTNPIDLLPKNEQERIKLTDDLQKLKKLNFHLMGFNKRSFTDHLTCVNWVNSYLDEDQIFPIFYEPENIEKSYLDFAGELSDGGDIENPIYFVDKNGIIKILLNGINPENRNLNKVLYLASKMVLSEQNFQTQILLKN